MSWFHAAQFEACRREFKDWQGKTEQRQRFRDAVAAIANRRVLGYVGSVVPPYAQLKPLPQPENIRDAKEIAWEYEWTRMTRDPYSVALSSCVARAIRNIARPMREKLNVILSHQAGRIENASLVHTAAGFMPEFEPYLGELVQGEPQNPRSVLPLQLADLVAWDVYRQRSRRGVWTGLAPVWWTPGVRPLEHALAAVGLQTPAG